ncbi:hypothetical protein ABPG74_000518 [Tetrahymena malaccensis]
MISTNKEKDSKDEHSKDITHIIQQLKQANDLNFSHFALDSIGKLMTIWTIRNERIEGYFYTIDPGTGNCIFQCIKSTEQGNKIVKRRFYFKDILMVSQQSENNQIATFLDRQEKNHHVCRNRSYVRDIMLDEDIVKNNRLKKQQQELKSQKDHLQKDQFDNQNISNSKLMLEKYSFEGFEHIFQQNQAGLDDILTEEQFNQFNCNLEEEGAEQELLIDRMFNHQEISQYLEEFNPDYYTTILDIFNISKEKYNMAESLEREIQRQKSENMHIQDDRNDVSIHRVFDDNTLYSSVSRGQKMDKADRYKEPYDDFSTKANSTQDSMRPDSAKSEQSVQKGGGSNLKSKGKKLRLTNNTFEPPVAHQTQNERFQINKMVNIQENFNLQEIFLDKIKSTKENQLEYIEEKQMNYDCSWRSFLSDQKKDHILLFNSLMIKSCHTSSGSSIGSRISNGFRQNTKINHNKFNQFFNQAALAMQINMQQNMNSSFTLNNVAGANNLNLSSGNLNSSFTNLSNPNQNNSSSMLNGILNNSNMNIENFSQNNQGQFYNPKTQKQNSTSNHYKSNSSKNNTQQ